MFANVRLYGIIIFMSKTILVAGKDMPNGMKLAEGLEATERKVAVSAAMNESDDTDQVGALNGTLTVEWNRASPVSARAFVLSAETVCSNIDEAVLYFDEELYTSISGKLDSEECLKCSDSMVLGYQYLSIVLLERFERKRSAENPGTLVFVLRKSYDCADVERTPSLRNGMNSMASPVISAAAASFEAFAENIAALYGDSEYANIVLVKIEADQDTSDETVGKWIGEYLDELGNAKAKKSVQWVKPGVKAKPAAGRGFFGRR